MKNAVMIVVAVAAAAALGVLVQRQLAPRNPAVTTPAVAAAKQAPVTDAADAAAAAAEEATSSKVPAVLPQFALADRDGKKRTLQEWSGRPLMVNFWATWCPPCRKEIPLLNKLHQQRAAQRLEIVGVAVDFRDDVLAYAKETAINYPLLIGEEDGMAAMKSLGMNGAGFPFTFFADSKQRIVALKVGELHQDEADLILDRVMAIDAGKLELPAAREQITEGLKEIATRRAADEAKAHKTG